MPAVRWVIRRDALGHLNTSPLLRELADMVAEDARRVVPVDTGALQAGIHVDEVTDDTARVVSSRDVEGDDPKVPIYVERGTSRMAAQPYLRPALYRYRAGR